MTRRFTALLRRSTPGRLADPVPASGLTFTGIFPTTEDYWDAALGTSVTGGKLTNWIGQVSGTNDLAQPTEASRPTYNASGLNGLPDITISGGLHALDTTLSSTIGNGDRFAILWVGNIDAQSSDFRRWILVSNSALTVAIQPATWQSKLQVDWVALSDGSEQTVINATPDTNSHRFHAVCSASGNIASEDGSDVTGSLTGTTTDDVERMSLGHSAGTQASTTTSFIGLVKGDPTAQQYTDFATWVNGRWGI
jgi:hypothetical protein